MLPATTHTCQPHVPNMKTIISINLKSKFTKTNNHVIIHSQLIVIRHNATAITYLHASTYQLSQHICISTIILKQDHWNTY